MQFEKRLCDMDKLGPFIEESINSGKKVKLTVTGDSMYPLLKSRVDTVVLAIPLKKDEHKVYKKYDIVFYKRDNGRYILHRILKEKDGAFVIAGDNETIKEYPVRKEQIIAKVTGFERKNKFHSSDELFYRIYAFLWVNLFPIRHVILKIAFRIYRIILKIKQKDERK